MSIAFVGKDVALSISYDVDTPSYTLLGGCTTKSTTYTIDNIDVTSDDSPGSFREFIESFSNGTLSFAMYPGRDETRRAAVDELYKFIKDPSTQSKTNREVLFQIESPGVDATGVAQVNTEVAKFLINSVSTENPHDGAVALTFEAQEIAAPTITTAAE